MSKKPKTIKTLEQLFKKIRVEQIRADLKSDNACLEWLLHPPGEIVREGDHYTLRRKRQEGRDAKARSAKRD